MLAFVPGDEEQGRGTLHSHWQCWLTEISQGVRNFLFAKSKHEREKARADFLQHIDAVLNASYGSDLIVTHNYVNEDGAICQQTDVVEEIFQERKIQVLRNARHKRLCHEVNRISGKVAYMRPLKLQASLRARDLAR